MRARVPASTSNLGPGFDVLGLALSCYVEVEVRGAERFSLQSEGEGVALPADQDHLAARVAIEVAGTDCLAITVRSAIPLGRGLGSSAALALAAAAAAGAADPLAVAARVDGHAENAAASATGGLVAATFVDGAVVSRRLPLDPGLRFALIVPDRALATKTARSVLPEQVPFRDAVFNLGRLGLLLAGLADRGALVPEAADDRLHQGPRTALFPEAPRLLTAMRDAGATCACWSGAGPSLLGICTGDAAAAAVAGAGTEALAEVGLPGRTLVLEPDLAGLVLSA